MDLNETVCVTVGDIKAAVEAGSTTRVSFFYVIFLFLEQYKKLRKN